MSYFTSTSKTFSLSVYMLFKYSVILDYKVVFTSLDINLSSETRAFAVFSIPRAT